MLRLTLTQMKASALINELQQLMEKHGDVIISVSLGPREYSMDSLGYVPEGPLLNLGTAQGQNPPDRIVLDAEDKLDDTD